MNNSDWAIWEIKVDLVGVVVDDSKVFKLQTSNFI